MLRRSAGILVHPTSLPGRFGIGDLGSGTLAFLDWAAAAGQQIWQLLPLGPTGPCGSPYASHSAFAGDALLISPEWLATRGWLPRESLPGMPVAPAAKIDHRQVAQWKQRLLRESWSYFRKSAPREAQRIFEAFVEDRDQHVWLEDWTLYAALKVQFKGKAWTSWEPGLRVREPQAVKQANLLLAEEISYQRYIQFLFSAQWAAVRQHAHKQSIKILGDLPFYLAHDSADIWANQELFKLDERGAPTSVAGVPPDYFSDTGQLWGNPIFDWAALADRDYDWWIARLKAELRRVDLLRLDHFRAFSAFWEIEPSAKTAINGRWVEGPGRRFFETLRKELGSLPLIAEDLGEITPAVRKLRDRFNLPGMRVLQFAFDGQENEHLPENHTSNSVVYTGTHDNDTTLGWFASLEHEQQQRVLEILETDAPSVRWKMIETAYRSPARFAIIPLQDVLGLGSAARMNKPGTSKGNWTWRAAAALFTKAVIAQLHQLAHDTNRLPSTLPEN